MNRRLYIINPAGHGGKGTAAWDTFKTLWPDPIDPEHVMITERPGHAREIAACAEGVDTLVAVGGDGTIGEVISGIMDREEPRPNLAVIPTGTGNDIGRSIGVASLVAAVGALQGGQAQGFDLVRIDCQRHGAQAHGYGFLFGTVGFSAISTMRPWMKRLLSAKGSYYLATFLQILTYRAPHMTVQARSVSENPVVGPRASGFGTGKDGEAGDIGAYRRYSRTQSSRETSRSKPDRILRQAPGDKEFKDRMYIVIAGNAEYAGGGGVRMSPDAVTDDGLLNITVIPNRSKLNVITRLFPRIAAGTHINEPGVSYFTGKQMEVHSNPPAVLEVDGDLFGTTPATFTLCEHAIQIICPPGLNTEN